MNITIDSSDYDRLNQGLKDEQQRNRELNEQIKMLDPNKVEARIRKLAWALFEKYIDVVFKKLGFGPNRFDRGPINECHVFYEIGELWFEQEDRISVSIGANVHDSFREAFLHLGVIPKPQTEKSTLIQKLENEQTNG